MFYSRFYLIRCKKQSKKKNQRIRSLVYSRFFSTVPVLVEETGQGYLPERVQTFCKQFLYLDNKKKLGKWILQNSSGGWVFVMTSHDVRPAFVKLSHLIKCNVYNVCARIKRNPVKDNIFLKITFSSANEKNLRWFTQKTKHIKRKVTTKRFLFS